uniref:Glycosyltransferase family 92 protein n=1 Tax=Steinernema glaseri TaxID=37863 RepID=A0A1I7ZF79_9BILA
MPRSRRLLSLVLFSVVVLSFFGLFSSWKRRILEDRDSRGRDDSLALGILDKLGNSKNGTKFLIRVDPSIRGEATIHRVQNRCSSCFWNPHVIEARFDGMNLSSVTALEAGVYWKGRFAFLPYAELRRAKRKALCVEPLFWFSDLRTMMKLLKQAKQERDVDVFATMKKVLKQAKQEGDVDIFVYLHSVSTEVWRLLRSYEREGVVVRIPFDVQNPQVRMDLSSWNALALKDCRLRASNYTEVEKISLASSRSSSECFAGCFNPSSSTCSSAFFDAEDEWMFVEQREHPYFVL